MTEKENNTNLTHKNLLDDAGTEVNPNLIDQLVELDKLIGSKDKRQDNDYKSLEPVFITADTGDKLTIEINGGDTLLLPDGAGQLIKTIKDYDIQRPLIILSSHDAEHEKENNKIFYQIRNAGLEIYKLDIIPTETKATGDYKDIQEFYAIDPEKFKQAIAEAKRIQFTEFEKSFNYYKQSDFLNGLSKSATTPAIPTGFKTLDSAGFLDGGLYEGLYIIGAISSLGKTTLMLQIADQIASAGQDVLYISLEMSTNELIAKSISRYTTQDIGNAKDAETLPKTVRNITDMRRYQYYTGQEIDHINKAIGAYFKDTGKTMRIVEGIGNITADTIEGYIKEHIRHKGQAPIVFIDYLQLLAQPLDENGRRHSMTDKQITDLNVLRLKQISRDYKTPVFAISSFNRNSYHTPVSMESFKESGAIEYSSDILIGLERKDAGIKDPEKIEERNRREIETGIREVRLKILKNRNGQTGGQLLFNYSFKYNLFTEAGDERKAIRQTEEEDSLKSIFNIR